MQLAAIKCGASLDEMLAWARNAIMDYEMPSAEAIATMALAREVDRLRAELANVCEVPKRIAKAQEKPNYV